MSSALTKLMELIDGIESEREMLIRLIIAVLTVALTSAFRNQISRAISALFCRLFLRKSQNLSKAVKSSVYKPLSYFSVVMGLYIGTEVLFPSGNVHNAAAIILKLCFICLSAWFGINLINSDYSANVNDDISNSKKTALKFINNILKIVIFTVALLLVLEQFGISASKLFAALGIGGVAVAFACKDMVENMLSGFIIIFDKPFEVGDFIELNGGKGTVTDIKIRTTRLMGVDGCEKVFPNTTMANSSITNWTKMQKRAVDETISINYSATGDEIGEICEGIKEIILKNENVLTDDVRVNFIDFGNHALEINVFFYVDKTAVAEYLRVKNDINIALKNYFDSQNISLAFESKTVYFGDELKIQK